ncbi:DUF3558 domain-containing protein [Amycolatopsis sp. NPDC059027]|uniref:DUF3558 domain-containing protein n=1 Tax=Amycolatopsis sp. NPDC059027 TaxID=3346709 RepID=UPI00366A57E7
MRSAVHRIAPVLGVVALALTACSTDTPGNAQPSPGTSSSRSQTAPPPGSADQVPGPGVPKVNSPIDTTSYHQTPCTTLTEAQVSELLGADARSKSDLNDPAGPTCTWRPPGNSNTLVQVSFFTADATGLSRIYRQRGNDYKFFMELPPIAGFPAVAYDVSDRRNTKGECIVAIGTSDTSRLDSVITLSDKNIGKKDPCEIAQKVAGEALANVKGGR